jgi:large subunit ribosomal protein L9
MSTKVILTQTVRDLGTEGELKSVSDGYARNYLLPQKMAVEATAQNLKRYEARRQQLEEARRAEEQQAKKLAAQLAEHSYTITAKAGPDGKLFGSISAADIAGAVRAEGIEIDRHQIVVDHAIREVGVYEIVVKLFTGISATVKIWVVTAEGAAAGEAAATREE